MPGLGLFGCALFLMLVPVLPMPIASPGFAAPARALFVFEFGLVLTCVGPGVIFGGLELEMIGAAVVVVVVVVSSFFFDFQNFQPASVSPETWYFLIYIIGNKCI